MPELEQGKRGGGTVATRRRRRRWTLAVALAVGTHALAFLLMGLSPVRQSVRAEERRSARWVGERTGDTIDLIDPQPLFLPTRLNAAGRLAESSSPDDSGAVFRLFEPELSVPRGSSPAGLVTLPEGVRTAGVAIRRFSRPYFSAFGRVDQPVVPLALRAAAVEVQDAVTGRTILQREIAVDDAVAQGGEPTAWPFWQPFEMMVAVEVDGLLGLPLVSAPGSGSEVVDAFFRRSFRALIRPDLALRPGYYRVLIGP